MPTQGLCARPGVFLHLGDMPLTWLALWGLGWERALSSSDSLLCLRFKAFLYHLLECYSFFLSFTSPSVPLCAGGPSLWWMAWSICHTTDTNVYCCYKGERLGGMLVWMAPSTRPSRAFQARWCLGFLYPLIGGDASQHVMLIAY